MSQDRCEQSEATSAYALQVLATNEVAAAEAHIASCPDCQRELESLLLQIAQKTAAIKAAQEGRP